MVISSDRRTRLCEPCYKTIRSTHLMIRHAHIRVLVLHGRDQTAHHHEREHEHNDSSIASLDQAPAGLPRASVQAAHAPITWKLRENLCGREWGGERGVG